MEEVTKSAELNVENLRKALQVLNEDTGSAQNEKSRHLLGKVLTIIDASMPDPEQRKAVKDLINNEWWGGDRLSTFDVHADIRNICKTFGFELYSDTASPIAVPSDTYNRFEKIVK